jgi:hypothetical protein
MIGYGKNPFNKSLVRSLLNGEFQQYFELESSDNSSGMLFSQKICEF